MNCVLYREGASPGDRWKWNETIGPVVDRPGREGEYLLLWFIAGYV